MSQPTLKLTPENRHARLVRISSVSVASVLALLIGTSVLPPIVADQSDRAVVNAPVTLLTAPIAGDVGTIPVKAGERVERDTLIARLSNNRLDRSTAIQLAGRVSELRERALAAENKRRSNQAYLDVLDREIRAQSSQMQQVLQAQVEELKAKIASAAASGEEKKVLMERQLSMVARNVASPDMVKSTTQAHAAALYERDAATAKLSQKTMQLDGLKRELYAGDELRGLAELAQKRLSITYDTQRLSIEETELKAAMTDQDALLTRENARLDRLAASEIRAPGSGIVYNVNAAAGRHVSAGDSLASVVDCERSFVVAIFSYRQGQNLQVGSPVTISGEPGGPRSGVVTEILPKTSDTVDATYAVPFPQTERRELYVLVKPDAPAGQGGAGGVTVGPACGVGRWVTVTRDAGWVPSNSVVWREIEGGVTGAVSRVASVAPTVLESVVGHADAAVSYTTGFLRQSDAQVSNPSAPARTEAIAGPAGTAGHDETLPIAPAASEAGLPAPAASAQIEQIRGLLTAPADAATPEKLALPPSPPSPPILTVPNSLVPNLTSWPVNSVEAQPGRMKSSTTPLPPPRPSSLPNSVASMTRKPTGEARR